MKSLPLDEFLRRQAARLQGVPDDFIEQVGAAQRQIYERINRLLSRLERDGDDIKQSVKNTRIGDEIRDSLPGIMEDSKYSAAISAFVSEFDGQKKIIDAFVSAEFGDKVKSAFADAVLEQAKRNATEVLASQTVTTKFLEGLQGQIDIAVQSGQSFKQTVDQLRAYATGTNDTGAPISGRGVPGGKLLQYSKQIAYDSIAVADRAYTNAVAKDLEPEWYFFAGGLMPSSRQFCLDRAGKYYHKNEIEDWANEDWAGKMENTSTANIFVVLGGHNCQHTLIPVTIERVPAEVVARNIANGNYKPEENFNKEQKEEFKDFPRDEELTGNDVKVQEDSIKYFIENKERLASDYLEKFGNIANTDEARKLFKVVGYNGANARAVHEAASALNKVVTNKLIETGEMNHIVMYAGGAGSGKTSAISGLFKGITGTADVIIDGTMATYAKSLKLVDGFMAANKTVDIMYVYRDPVDAWVNGVIKRALENKAEAGRVVPLRTFLENTQGSYNTMKQMLSLGEREGIDIHLIDNSLGKGNTRFMSIDKFNSIEFDGGLKQRLIDETKKLLDAGRITKKMYDDLING